MKRRLASIWVRAGLAVLGAMAAAGDARAGISVGGGFKPVNPDPTFEYLFHLQSTVEIDHGFSFAVSDLASLLSSAEAPADWHVSLGVDSDNLTNFAGIATWTYEGRTPIIPTATHPDLFLTGFNVFTGDLQTEDKFPQAGSFLEYSYSLTPGGITEQGLTFQLQSVPEPSSALIVLVVGGTAGGSGLVARAWRRRAARAS